MWLAFALGVLVGLAVAVAALVVWIARSSRKLPAAPIPGRWPGRVSEIRL